LVPERSNYVVVDSLAKQGVDAQTFDAQCSVRAKLPPLNTPAHCKYEVVQPVAISDYYPDASRTAAEEGPVIVEFTLAGKAGRPTQVRAVAGSLFESLDQAAVKAVSDMVMSSNCKKSRYRLKLSFQLN
jgi:TonB family protein